MLNFKNILKYWYLIVIFLMLIVLIRFYKQLYIDTPPPPSIGALRDSVEQLNNQVIQLQADYDSTQTTIIQNITAQNETDRQTIDNIRFTTNDERDAAWSALSATEDSIPQRYWDILYTKTRGKTAAELGVQRGIQK